MTKVRKFAFMAATAAAWATTDDLNALEAKADTLEGKDSQAL